MAAALAARRAPPALALIFLLALPFALVGDLLGRVTFCPRREERGERSSATAQRWTQSEEPCGPTYDRDAQLLAQHLGVRPLEHAVLEAPLLGHLARRPLLQQTLVEDAVRVALRAPQHAVSADDRQE